jgi:hypothetical protein
LGVIREQFLSYMQGWRDRAVGGANKRDAFKHRVELLREYDRGWDEAGTAKRIATAAAAKRLGYDLERAAIDR